MKEKKLTIPEIGQIAVTRVALGMGIGLLLSRRLNNDQKTSAGLALLVVGIASTIPIVLSVLGQESSEKRSTEVETAAT
jgi:hypothetical protein